MDEECLHFCTQRSYVKPFAFNAAYTLFVSVVSFWFGTLFALHWGVNLAIQLDLYFYAIVCAMCIFGMILFVTLPGSSTPYTLLT